MVLAIRMNPDGPFRELVSQQAIDRTTGGVKISKWTPIEVDLSEFAGRDITLRLSLETERLFRRIELSWWGSPRIAIRPNPDRP